MVCWKMGPWPGCHNIQVCLGAGVRPCSHPQTHHRLPRDSRNFQQSTWSKVTHVHYTSPRMTHFAWVGWSKGMTHLHGLVGLSRHLCAQKPVARSLPGPPEAHQASGNPKAKRQWLLQVESFSERPILSEEPSHGLGKATKSQKSQNQNLPEVIIGSRFEAHSFEGPFKPKNWRWAKRWSRIIDPGRAVSLHAAF